MTADDNGKRDTRDIVRGALVNFIGVVARSLNFAFYIFLGRLYGAEATGLYLLSWASVDVASKLGILGLDRAILSVVARHHSEKDEDAVYRAIGQALCIGALATVIIVATMELVAAPIALHFYDKPELVLPLRVMAWGMPFWTISAIFLFATRALRVMRYEVITKSVIEPLVMLTLAVLFFFLDMGMFGLSLAFLCSVAAGALVAVYFFSRELSLKRVVLAVLDKEGRSGLLRFAAPIGFYDMLNLLLQRIDMFMVGRYVPTAMVGVYGIAEEAAFTVKKVRQSFDPIFIPVISAAHQVKDRAGMLLQYRNVTRWILLLDGAALGVVILAGRPIMGIFGADFSTGAVTLGLLSLSVVINGVFGVSELFLLISRPMVNLMNTIGTIIVNVGLNLLLIPRYGMEGAALAITISYAFMNAARVIEVSVLFKLHPFTRQHGRILLAWVLAFAAMFGLQLALNKPGTGPDLAFAGIYLLVYGLLQWLIGLMPEEKQIGYKILRKLGLHSGS